MATHPEPDWARPVVHWELAARDPELQAAFYRSLFNWEIGQGSIVQIAPGLGGPEPGPAGHIRQSDAPGLALYVQVRDLEAALSLAESLGGRTLLRPFDVPNGPTLAAISDPEGNQVVLVQQ